MTLLKLNASQQPPPKVYLLPVLKTGHEKPAPTFQGSMKKYNSLVLPYLPGTEGMVMLSEQVLKTTSIPISERVRTWALEVASRQVDIYNDLIKQGGAV